MNLKNQYETLDEAMDKLIIGTIRLFRSLGHKTNKCLSCHQETDLNVLENNIGYCSTCKVLNDMEADND